jgi:hypothetical protein
MMNKLIRPLLGTAILLLAVGGVAGVALAADSDEREAKREAVKACAEAKEGNRREAVRECAKEQGVAGHRRPGRVLGHAAHGELIVPKRGAEGQWETVVLDRGEVTSMDDASITLKRPDGPSVTLGLTPETRFPDGRPEVGKQARVLSIGGVARLVMTVRD